MVIDMGAFLFGDGPGLIGAVIAVDEDLDEVLGVIEGADAVDEVADDFLFVPGGDDEGVAVFLLGRGIFAA